MKATVFYWLKKPCDDALLDKAYDNGLVDPDWVKKGGRTFVEFNREGETVDEIVAGCKADLEKHGIGFKDKVYVLEIDGVRQNVDPRYS